MHEHQCGRDVVLSVLTDADLLHHITAYQPGLTHRVRRFYQSHQYLYKMRLDGEAQLFHVAIEMQDAAVLEHFYRMH